MLMIFFYLYVIIINWQVDENVTRHHDFELKQRDWRLMILHYLGLDHGTSRYFFPFLFCF